MVSSAPCPESVATQGKLAEAEKTYDRLEKICPAGSPAVFTNKGVMFSSQVKHQNETSMPKKSFFSFPHRMVEIS